MLGRSEVTEVDMAVEELLRTESGHRVPDDGIFGEEGGATSGSSGRRWVIDPINGITLFTRRVPLSSNDLDVVKDLPRSRDLRALDDAVTA